MPQQRLEEWLSQSLRRESQPRLDLSQLAKLTVVIPSYGRQAFILRQAVYWGKDGAQVVVVDGSPKPLSLKIQEMLSNETSIKYFHLLEDILARLRLAAQHIHTPYAVLLGDDEFHLKKGLCQAVEKLENDSTLVACIGQSITFHPSKGSATVTYSTGYPHWRYHVTQDDFKERLISAMSNYNCATCYAVLREPAWSRSWGTLRTWSHLPAAELQQAIVTYIHGKLTTVDRVYWLRSNENPPVKIEKSWEPHKHSFVDWWVSPEFNLERASFVEVLANEAVSTRQIGYAEAKEIVLEAMSSYLESSRKRNRLLSSLRAATVNRLKSMSSTLLRVLLTEEKVLKLKTVLKMKNSGSWGAIDDLKRTKQIGAVSMDDDLFVELSEIEELVESFYKARLHMS